MSKLELMAYGDYRSRLDDDNMLVIHVGSNDEIMDDATITAVMDGRTVPVTTVRRNTIRAKFCYKAINMKYNCEYQFCIRVTDNFRKVALKFEFGEKYNNQQEIITVKGKRYRDNQKKIPCVIDTYEVTDDGLKIYGWAASLKDIDICPMVGGKPVECKINKTFRKDIVDYYQEKEFSKSAGFEIFIPEADKSKVMVNITDGTRKTVEIIDISKKQKNRKISFANLFRVTAHIKKYGLWQTIRKIFCKLIGKDSFSYNAWIEKEQPNDKELANQRAQEFSIKPKFSIVVPVYRPNPEYFTEMIKSVVNQTYSNWELCLADGGGDETMEGVVSRFLRDNRIKYVKLDKNLGISGNTNAALELANGDYIVLGDHDDIIRPDALFECAKAINENPDTDVIYSDEDKLSANGKKRMEPNFKPDFNLELLRSVNYICHLFVFSKKLYEMVGGFNSEYDGAQDHDMIFRCVEQARVIKHIPKVLYSWRLHKDSTAANPESKKYAIIAGAKAVKAHLDRVGIAGEVKINDDMPGVYRVIYTPENEPFVSIIIPNKDHIDDLDKCVKSVVKQDYDKYEIIVVENNSTDEATFEYYRRAEKEYSKLKVVYWKEDFNYSKINNFGVQYAQGEYYLLLNNDTEMIEKDCLRSLVSYGARPGTGIVGAKLLYNDNTIQHAGVVVGLGGVANHVFIGNELNDYGYQWYANIAREYTAVTAACLLVKKEAYEEVGGLEEDLKVAFNDVDFCLKVREKGYRVIYNPYALLYHYESKSRGYEDTPEKIERFQGEATYLVDKWSKIMDEGDPHYNPNLSLATTDFSIREN